MKIAAYGAIALATTALCSPVWAHTVSIGYENAGPGSVNFWYGSYHDEASEPTGNEGSMNLNGPGTDATVPFDLLTQTKPSGLVDGTTNFYTDGIDDGALVGDESQCVACPVNTWQGVTFDNLTAGTYTFTYIPDSTPSAFWDDWNNEILSNTVTLTGDIVGGATGIFNVYRDLADIALSRHLEALNLRRDGRDYGGAFAPIQPLTTALSGAPAPVSSQGSNAMSTEAGAGTLRGFANAFYSFGEVDGTSVNTGFDYDGFGLVAGADYELDLNSEAFSNAIVGAALGYQNMDADHANGADSTDANVYSITAYGGVATPDGIYGDAALNYSYIDYDTDLSSSGASPDANVFGALARVGIDTPNRTDTPLGVPGYSLGVYGEASYSYIDVSSFSFSDGSSSVEGYSDDSLLLGAGVRGSVSFAMDEGAVFGKLDLAVLTDVIGDDFNVTQNFGGSMTGVIPVDSNDPTMGRVRASVGFASWGAWTGAMEYSGWYSEDVQSHAVLGRVRMEF